MRTLDPVNPLNVVNPVNRAEKDLFDIFPDLPGLPKRSVRERVEEVAAQYGNDPLVAAVVSFIRAGSRPLTMAIRRAQAEQHLEQGC